MTGMTEGPDFSAYDARMQDPAYRAQMERTTPYTAEEEQELYRLLDEFFNSGEELNSDQEGTNSDTGTGTGTGTGTDTGTATEPETP